MKNPTIIIFASVVLINVGYGLMWSDISRGLQILGYVLGPCLIGVIVGKMVVNNEDK